MRNWWSCMENGTYTPKMHLYKPSLGEYGWGEEVDENFDIIDNLNFETIGAEPKIQHKEDAFNCDFGNTAGTICQGNDPRLQPFNDLPAHADTTTKYGVASDVLYGHTKASATLPKENGGGNAGTETNTFARGDHMHPPQKDVSGSAGTTNKIKTGRKIILSGGMSCKDTVFDGSKNIDIEVVGVKAENIKGEIPATSIPIATTTTKGTVIVGDGLKIVDGIISFDEKHYITTKVYSKGSANGTDIRLGTTTHTIEFNPPGFGVGISGTRTEDDKTIHNCKINKPILTKFEKSPTLPTVFEPDINNYQVPQTSHTVSASIGIYNHSTTRPTRGLNTSFDLIRDSNGSSFFSYTYRGYMVSGESVTVSITIPSDWNYETETFTFHGRQTCSSYVGYGSGNLSIGTTTATDTIYL